MSTTTLSAAQGLAARGFRVHPVRVNSKKPVLGAWQHKASNDPETVRRMWTDGVGNQQPYNIGVAAGEGLFFLDVDVNEEIGKDGFKSLFLLELENGELPRTQCVQTPSGGKHYYFRVPDGVKIGNSVGNIGVGLDIRGDGGYVVAPGSSINGRSYEWVDGCSPDDIEIAVSPEWLIKRIGKRKDRKKCEIKVRPGITLDQPHTIEGAKKWLINSAPEAIQGAGGRNVAKQVINTLYDFGLSENAVNELMLGEDGWDAHKAFPPWASPDEIDDLERLIRELPASRENPIGCKYHYPASEDFEPYFGDIGEPGQAKPQTEKRRKFRFERFDEAAEKALTERGVPLIKGLLDQETFVLLFGPSNSGKSFVAASMAYAIGTGTRFAGMRSEHGTVMYIAAEGGRAFRGRIQALKMKYSGGPDVRFLFASSDIDLLNGASDVTALVQEVKCEEAIYDSPVKMIIIDTLAASMAGGDENTFQDMGAVIGNAIKLIKETGATVMLIHHTGKDTSRGARGHSSLRAAVDTELEIKAAKKIDGQNPAGEIIITKQRDIEMRRSLVFEIEPVNIGFDKEDMESIRSCVAKVRSWDAKMDKKHSQLELLSLEMLDVLNSKTTTGTTTEEWDNMVMEERKKRNSCSATQDVVRKMRKNLEKNRHVRMSDNNQWVRV